MQTYFQVKSGTDTHSSIGRQSSSQDVGGPLTLICISHIDPRCVLDVCLVRLCRPAQAMVGATSC